MHDDPLPFVEAWLPRLAGALATAGRPAPRALDLAMGRGRHAVCLCRAGFVPFGVDRRFDAVLDARKRVAAAGCALRAWVADLERSPLPARWFDLVLCTRYLQRDLIPALRAAVTPGGFVLYATFTEGQRLRPAGPRSPAHLLAPGELPALFDGWSVMFTEEVETDTDAVARLIARKPDH
ncbi:MAG TPA: class I SAM-dependent methyltransferase [Vicinamibacterales bacterium]|nr:class I SAM-dependent methyltransferase [Vicinamibacterales bacterium]